MVKSESFSQEKKLLCGITHWGIENRHRTGIKNSKMTILFWLNQCWRTRKTYNSKARRQRKQASACNHSLKVEIT